MFSRHGRDSGQPMTETYELVSDGDDTEAPRGDESPMPVQAAANEPIEQDPHKHQGPPRTTNSRSAIRIWWPEVALCMLVFAALAAIVALRVSDGKPLPKLPYRMSINTLVAIYILAMKVSILVIVSNGIGQLKWAWFSSDEPRPLSQLGLLDDASHDLQGAVIWLWKMRFDLSIPSLGAVVMVLATILDPFGQQIIKFYSCTVQDSSISASIATSHIPQAFFYADSAPTHLRPELGGAIYQGLYTNRPVQVPFSCSSGECKFPNQYHSTGICARCTDMTSRITIQRASNVSVSNTSDAHDKVALDESTVFRLPSGLNATSLRPYLVDVTGTIGGITPFDTSGQGNLPTEPYLYNNIKLSMLLGLFANRSEALSFEKYVSCSSQDMWGCKGYGAAECYLYPCVRTFQADVQAGILTNTLLGEAAPWGYPRDSSLCSTIDTTCLNDSERKALVSRGYKIKANEPWLAYNLSDYAQSAYDKFHRSRGKPTNNPDIFNDITDIRPECIYQVSQLEWYHLLLYIMSRFAELGGDTTTTTGFLAMWNNIFYEGGNISTATIETRVTRLAHAMSTAYQELGTSTRAVGNDSRVYNTSSTSRVTGEGLRSDTCVAVQWPWITFPAVLALATLFFLVWTVAKTSWHRGGNMSSELRGHDYKTSVVPLLLHGLYHDPQGGKGQSYQDVGTTSGKMKSASETRVRFEETPAGWRLVERERGCP
ncbi:hypothetical protein QBC34DRAFT_66948 [Podospora aff. communis PSN243]|uniref:Uncharacterized protein n=1 Tax=Podospora aff. communis PSN243 TaxID=3040156 RepID=A0AAV9H604_9PEZI|nr:hypothetical protein QBC34DRAFT_66948 [Podospora aff. communis PSN243]